MLIREAPKYGNDDDYVDQLIVEAYDSYIEEIEKYPNTRYNRGPIGGIRYAGTSSISANVGQGMSTMLRRMDEMRSNLWQKVAVQRITAIKMDLQLCLKVCLSFVQIKLRVEFC